MEGCSGIPFCLVLSMWIVDEFFQKIGLGAMSLEVGMSRPEENMIDKGLLPRDGSSVCIETLVYRE